MMKSNRRKIVSTILAVVGVVSLAIGVFGYIRGGEIFYNEPFPFLVIGVICAGIGFAMLKKLNTITP